MRQTIIQTSCDRCLKKESARQYSIDVERYCDASGNTSTRTLEFDLCDGCLSIVFGALLEVFSRDHNFIELLKSKIPQTRFMD